MGEVYHTVNESNFILNFVVQHFLEWYSIRPLSLRATEIEAKRIWDRKKNLLQTQNNFARLL